MSEKYRMIQTENSRMRAELDYQAHRIKNLETENDNLKLKNAALYDTCHKERSYQETLLQSTKYHKRILARHRNQ